MTYTTFNQVINDPLKEPMFCGNAVNVSRFDQAKLPVIVDLTEKQISFFWRPEEVDIGRDSKQFTDLAEHEKHIFISNLKYQTLLDSIAARSVNMVLLPLVSLPEIETWVETWAFYETIHSRSYTHILRNLFTDPSPVFDDILINEDIMKRATAITQYFDEVILLTQLIQSQGEGTYQIEGREVVVTMRNLKKALYLAVCAVNALEGIRFYVSFACSFAFAERELMEGNAKIIKLIARDESTHLVGTQYILNAWANGDDDPEMKEIAEELKDVALKLFMDVVDQEKEWADYLFKDGSMIGLNGQILEQYIEYIANVRLIALGHKPPFAQTSNPLPWINSYLASDNVQVAPQEAEISSYLVGQIDSKLDSDDFDDFDL